MQIMPLQIVAEAASGYLSKASLDRKGKCSSVLQKVCGPGCTPECLLEHAACRSDNQVTSHASAHGCKELVFRQTHHQEVDSTVQTHIPFRPLTIVCCGREECDQYVAGLWDWLEGLGTGIQRRDPATWTPERWPPTYRGILNTLEVAHQAFVWRVRKHERIRKVTLASTKRTAA